MQILQKHRTPYNGFAFDHPLRKYWRDQSYADPEAGRHAFQYSFRKVFCEELVVTLAVTLWIMGFLMFAVGGHGDPGLRIFSGVVGVGFPALGILIAYGMIRNSQSGFGQWVADIAALLEINPEQLSEKSTWVDLRIQGERVLIEKARHVIAAEEKAAQAQDEHAEISAEEERIKKKEIFRTRFGCLESRHLIVHTDHGWYFRKAAGK